LTERKNMIFDRTLSPELFEVAYRVAGSGQPFEKQRQLLMVALRDHTTEQEAGNKTKKLLTRVWINPPVPAAPMIRWAVDHPESFPDRRVMHLGALIATFPFVGSVASILGRAFVIDSAISGIDLRRRVVAVWGARTMVDLGAGKSAGTLRKFQVLAGGGRNQLIPGEKLAVAGEAAAWLAHATMLTRGQQAIDARELEDVPELFWSELGDVSTSYPLLELYREGSARDVYAVR
jgi:hypothetical protein